MCSRTLCPNTLLRKVTAPNLPQIPSQKNQSSTAVQKKSQDVLKLLLDAVDSYRLTTVQVKFKPAPKFKQVLQGHRNCRIRRENKCKLVKPKWLQSWWFRLTRGFEHSLNYALLKYEDMFIFRHLILKSQFHYLNKSTWIAHLNLVSLHTTGLFWICFCFNITDLW